MITLDARNVLLKPCHRKQLLASLRRAMKLGQRLGDFVLKITLEKVGRLYEIRASVHDRAGDFGVRSRSKDWRDALRDLSRAISLRLQAQRLARAA